MMKGIKKIISHINKNDFRRYLIFSIVFIVTIIVLGSLKLTQARYETVTRINASPV